MAKTLLGALICIVMAIVFAFLLGGGTGTVQLLGLRGSLLFALVLLLLPFSNLNMGVWVGVISWIVGGFVGGLVCADYKKAVLVAIVSVTFSIVIAVLMDSQFFTSIGLNMFSLYSDFAMAFMVAIVGALIGTTLTKRQ